MVVLTAREGVPRRVGLRPAIGPLRRPAIDYLTTVCRVPAQTANSAL